MSEAEGKILARLDTAPTATHWFAKWAGIGHRQAYTILRRLRARGLAAGVEGGDGRIRWWVAGDKSEAQP